MGEHPLETFPARVYKKLKWRSFKRRPAIERQRPPRPHQYQPYNYKEQLELYKAAKKDDHIRVKNFFEKKDQAPEELAQIFIGKSLGPFDNTLLHVAASFGSTNTVKLIVDDLMCPSILRNINTKGDTALHVAAKGGHVSAARILVWKKSDVESSSSSYGGTTLRDLNLLQLKNKEGNTALHEALINSHIDVAEALIEAYPEVSFYLNEENKSPLYLAAEAGSKKCVESMLERSVGVNPDEMLKGKSPIHAAILGAAASNRRTAKDILECLLTKDARFINVKDEIGATVLHLAASVGYLEDVLYLLENYAFTAVQRDNDGFFPIHMAAINDHVDVIRKLLPHCPDPVDVLSIDGRNILHVAARNGAFNVVSYILRTPELETLINQRDQYGYTPLHLATRNWHPKILSALTWDKRVNLNLVDNKGSTALDIAERMMGGAPLYRQKLTWSALKAAGVPQGPSKKIHYSDQSPTDTPAHQSSTDRKGFNWDIFKDRISTLLLVTTLVVTVTFAAGFTVPGGYNGSDPAKGVATMLGHIAFNIFIFCDTIAMYSSILVAVVLIWAQLGDPYLMQTAVQLAVPLFGIALVLMTSAFAAGVYLAVSKVSWLAVAIIVISALFLMVLLLLFLPFAINSWSTNCIIRHLDYYPFQLLIAITANSK